MRTLTASLVLVYWLLTAPAAAQENNSGIRLGRPEALVTTAGAPAFIRVAGTAAQAERILGIPEPIVRGQNPDMPPPPVPPAEVTPPPPPPPGSAIATVPPAAPVVSEEPFNCGQVTKNVGAGGFFGRCWDKCKGWGNDLTGAFQAGPDRGILQSDHKYDFMISPVSNPFYFEDPRALTEVRPLFIWELTPRGNPVYNGGYAIFTGLQARVAITEWLSLVINKLGWIWNQPRMPPAGVMPGNGFAEIWLGPKITFWRGEKSLLAAGLTFEIPAGPPGVFQNTGSLSLTPYLSYGWNFLDLRDWGSFNFMTTTGYSFATDNLRSDHFFSSFHLDYDVGNLHRIYPLLELNWFQYTANGGAMPFGAMPSNFEGAGMFNFGSTAVRGLGELSLAVGLRFKFTDHIQAGLATEFGLINIPRTLDGFSLLSDIKITY